MATVGPEQGVQAARAIFSISQDAGEFGRANSGCGSAHAPQLPRWIHEMNPSCDLCNMCNRPVRKRDLRSCFWRVIGC